MTHQRVADEIDAALLTTLARHPSATNLALAQTTGLARNTVQARLSRYESEKSLKSFERRIDPAFLGYPITAFIVTTVRQRNLDSVSTALAQIPEVLEVHGLSGVADLLIHVVARNADDLYRITGLILAIDGVKRTNTGLVMRDLIEYRIVQLLNPTDRSKDRDS